jgi:hypothetical protein
MLQAQRQMIQENCQGLERRQSWTGLGFSDSFHLKTARKVTKDLSDIKIGSSWAQAWSTT